MGWGKDLTEEEKTKIDSLVQEGLSERRIANNIKRSITSVHNYLKKKRKKLKEAEAERVMC